MADKDYIFLISFLLVLVILALGIFYKIPYLVGFAIPFFILIFGARFL